ncbi:MAG: type II toxin-antitoxin system HigB family toxin [Cyanobacteria bacterium J06621_11]
MRFIKKSNLEEDLKDVPNAVRATALSWLKVVELKTTAWRNFMDVKSTINSASKVGSLYVFNIKDYRLIVGINFERQVIYYKAILSHSKYDKGNWKTKFPRSKNSE